jgi:hypothetical protein
VWLSPWPSPSRAETLIGLIVGGAMKVEGEVTGKSTIEGAAKRTAKAIADQLQVACQKQGWI